MRRKYPLTDFYIDHPFITDVFFAVVLFFAKEKLFNLTKIDLDSLKEISSSLISTFIAIAGFSLAALTIIVTFKSNIKTKNLKDYDNALDFLFSTAHYKSITNVFTHSIIEQSFCAGVLYILWLFQKALPIEICFWIVAYTLVVLITTLSRTLLILFNIITLELSERKD